jgi:1-pyrroline dehydrogenase
MSLVAPPEVPTLRHLIGSSLVRGSGEFAVYDPSSGEQIAVQPVATDAEVDAAVRAAAAAFESWRRTTGSERAALLLRLADLVDANAERFALLESLDVGKPIRAAREEIPGISDILRYYAGAVRIPHGTSSGVVAPAMHSRVEREPVGVVGLVTPWNYPLLEAVWKIGPALAAGNTLVLKPSEITPLTTVVLFDLVKDVFPAGVANLVLGDASTGKALVSHPLVQMVSLTGDVGTGKSVARAAADSLKRVHLELGGKAPVLVLPGANLTEAASFLATAGFANSGQDCTAACRIIVHEAVYDEFTRRYTDAADAIAVGSGLDEASTMGPLVSSRQRDRVHGFVERALSAGAQRLWQGEIPRVADGYFATPTVLGGVAQDSEVVQNEVFGPVVTIQRASSEEEMVRWANDVPYGLSASVWTDDLNAAQRASRELNFGTVWINTHLWTFPEAPFGGFGASGYGKELSPMSIDDYSRFKHILLQER